MICPKENREQISKLVFETPNWG